ncbi:MAG: Hpt domain-containing protein [Gammaproteobacteria bacterium]|nr:Hpt domain-containing protein [Gammaproteobacteria bacterium]
MLDYAVLDRLRRDLEGEIDWVIDLFLSELPGYLEAIQAAFDKGDMPAVYQAAHKCKGAGNKLGGIGLTALCLEIELLGRAGDSKNLVKLMPKLAPQAEKLKLALVQMKQFDAR